MEWEDHRDYRHEGGRDCLAEEQRRMRREMGWDLKLKLGGLMHDGGTNKVGSLMEKYYSLLTSLITLPSSGPITTMSTSTILPPMYADIGPLTKKNGIQSVPATVAVCCSPMSLQRTGCFCSLRSLNPLQL